MLRCARMADRGNAILKSTDPILSRIFAPVAAALLTLGLAGCGGSSSGSSGDGVEMGEFSLRLTDAPFTAAASVKVTFSEVHLKPADGGSWVRHRLEKPTDFDLMTLQGMATADLVVDVLVPAGKYEEIRLLVDDSLLSNNEIVTSTGTYSLTIPSGSSSGLKIKGNFTVDADRPANLIADVDLLQSLVLEGPGDYRLRPVIRLVEKNSAGHLRGKVDGSKLDDSATSCSDADPNSYNAVYVYSGHGADVEDIDHADKGDGDQPLTTAKIWLDPASGAYVYEVAFLPAGDYTLAFTCKADLEDLNGDDDLSFFDIRDVTVLVSDVLFL